MAKTIQRVVTIEVTVVLENDAQQYSNEEINNTLLITSCDRKNIKVKCHVAEEPKVRP